MILGSDAGSTVFEPGTDVIGRALTVLSGAHLALRNVTITGGLTLCVSDEGCARTQGGGAIENMGGYLSLNDCVLTSNNVLSENGPRRTIGGGIFASDATVIIQGSTISGNTVNEQVDEWIGQGAGIYTAGGVLWLTNSAVTENFIERIGAGGGIFNGGKMFIQNTTIAGNSAPTLGGGIYNNGPLTLQNVTITGNEVRGATSVGMNEPEYPYGCAVEAPERCISSGGGIWNEPTGTVRVATSLVAANKSREGASDCYGVLISKGHNAIGSDAQCDLQGSGANDQLNVDPRLGEMQDNGDPGDAHVPLLTNSPLIDAGGKVAHDCTPRDQLGHRRTDGDRDGETQCDVGAIEFLPRRRHP